MTTVHSSSGIEQSREKTRVNVECRLWIEELLEIDGLRNGIICICCSAVIGVHGRKSDYRAPMIQSAKRPQTDFQKMEPHETINQQGAQPIVTKDFSISPPRNPRTKNTPSISSQSTSLSSAKSAGSAGSLVRILTAPVASDSESSKQHMALSEQLKTRAMLKAAEARCKIIKTFLAKHCCSEYTDLNDLYYKLLSVVNNDHKRFYHLVQHAKHNCIGLVQFVNTTDRMVRLFELLNDIIPSGD